MSRYFVFASALPAVSFDDSSAAFSCEDFLHMAEEYLTEDDCTKLRKISLDGACLPAAEFAAGEEPFVAPSDPVALFYMWDTQLRNEIALRRGGMRSGFQEKYVAAVDGSLPQETVRCFEAENPWSKARAADRLRWQKLEELSVNHNYDWEYILLYYLKIQLLAKWTERTPERGKKNFEAAVRSIYAACGSGLEKE